MEPGYASWSKADLIKRAKDFEIQVRARGSGLKTSSDSQMPKAESALSACERVLGIEELREHILLHVPTLRLLSSAQRVCKSWKATIDTSIHLQQGLFLNPITVTATTRVLNPAIKRLQSDKLRPRWQWLSLDVRKASWRPMQLCQPQVSSSVFNGRVLSRFSLKSLFIDAEDDYAVLLSTSISTKQRSTTRYTMTVGYQIDIAYSRACKDWVEVETPMEVLRCLGVL